MLEWADQLSECLVFDKNYLNFDEMFAADFLGAINVTR
jgi:hypothetical protein